MKLAVSLVLAVFGATILDLANAGDCTVCKEITLSSPVGGPVTHELIDGASRVKKVTLRKETSATKGTCQKDATYGHLGAAVYVDNGCGGTFKVCYVKGRTEIVSCSSDGTQVSCDYPKGGGDCDVDSAIVTEATSTAPCELDYSFHATTDHIIVSRGCQGTFLIGCEDCSYEPSK